MKHPSRRALLHQRHCDTHVEVTVHLPRPLLRDVTRRWPGWTLDEKVAHAFVLALAWADHGDDEDPAA